ncbi:ParB/RepB/Spo0J family partition protein [Streptomyces sp. NPDC088190]|uniref:ParB/RepB/Spo0J family partition protein n=1 Tax=unclassified Streptomyces TaxID=2593676 RepID=UPI002E77FFAE|nr:ParB/RepB/Spo0J family partition protein [Streptomyces sp. JV190]MEE1844168.1 ParB/RepB/Spo0J family partition protein [Streptomyces sp. JV190]
MLSEDELLDLANSIKTEGQHEDIVLDVDGVLLDGRNRLAACKLAGVEPSFTTYTGNDPIRVIYSGNVYRRHISKGQQAMITAMTMRSVSGHSLRAHAMLHGLSRTRLSAANVVLTHAPALAEKVRTGTLGLDSAYQTACELKANAEALQERYDQLRRHDADLAEQVTAGDLALDDAIATVDRWEEAVRQAQQTIEQITANWPAVQELAARRDTRYAQEVIDGLTAEARALIDELLSRG